MSSQDWIEKLGRELLSANSPCGLIGEFDYIDKISQAYAAHCSSLPQLQEMAEGIATTATETINKLFHGEESVDVGEAIVPLLAPLYAELERLRAEMAARSLSRDELKNLAVPPPQEWLNEEW